MWFPAAEDYGFNVGDLVWFTNPRDSSVSLAKIEAGDKKSSEYAVKIESTGIVWLGVAKDSLQLAHNVVSFKKCECGAHSVGSLLHTKWCPLDSKE